MALFGNAPGIRVARPSPSAYASKLLGESPSAMAVCGNAPGIRVASPRPLAPASVLLGESERFLSPHGVRRESGP